MLGLDLGVSGSSSEDDDAEGGELGGCLDIVYFQSSASLLIG